MLYKIHIMSPFCLVPRQLLVEYGGDRHFGAQGLNVGMEETGVEVRDGLPTR